MSDVAGHDATAAEQLAPEGLFVRNATGLVRSMGAWDALSLAMGSIAVGGGFVAFFYMLGIFPRANLFLTFLLALVAALLLGAVYVQLVQAIPRTGGDYVYVSRILHPILGASIGGAEFLLFATFPAFWAANFSNGHVQAFIASFGDMVGSGTISNWGNSSLAGSKTISYVIGLLFILVLLAIAIYSTKLGARVLVVCFVLGLATLMVGIIVLATHSTGDFRNAFNHNYSGKATYQSVIAAGDKAGYHGGYSFGDTLGALPYAVLLIWGFSWAAYPGGELRNVSRTIKWSVFGSTAIAISFYLVATLAANHALGTRFMASANFLATKHANLYTVPDGPSMTLYTSMLSHSSFVRFCIAAIPIFTEIGLVLTYLMSTSRVLFALSFDRLLPPQVVALSRFGTPAIAIVLTAISIGVMFTFAIYSTLLGIWSNGTLGLAIVYVFVSLAGLVLVYRYPKIWQAGPRILAQKVAGVPAIAIVALLSAAFSFVIVLLAIFRPLGIGPLTWKSIVALIVAFAWGAFVYLGVRASLQRRGLKLDAVMTEIPPD
jgi:basic amino acid/polyamine antiporter, APA family